MGEIIGLLSGKGGTGKTSVCAGLGLELAAAGKQVLCIDCDVGLRNLDISLGMADLGAISFLDVASGHYSVRDAAQSPDYPTLRLLTAPLTSGIPAVDPILFGEMLQTLRPSFDYVLLDAPAGVDALFHLVAGAADRLLVVTGPEPAAIRDAARVGELLELAGKQNVRLVVNRVDRDLLGTVRLTVDDVMDSTGLPLLGVVPEDSHVTLAATFGQPLRNYSRRCAASKALRRIAQRLQGFSVPVPLH